MRSSPSRFPLILVAFLGLATTAQAQSPADPLVQQARDSAHADRNREAADRFAEAIARDPARRRELLREYADQLTYSGRAAQAVPLYREVLQAPRDDGEREGAQRGLGLALLWSDQAAQAVPVWREVLARHPDDADASRSLGRALSWAGRQRQAQAHLRAHLAAHPDDAEARVMLAQAQAWMGRGDEAQRTLAAAPASGRTDASRLARQLQVQASPRTELDLQTSSQSDDLDIRVARLAQSAELAQGRGTLAAELARIDYAPRSGGDGARVTRPMLGGRWRLADAWELHAQGGYERTVMADGTTHQPGVYATWLTWWPDDRFRFDASASRETFDNLRSLRMGLSAQQRGLSMDYTPSDRARYTVRLQEGSYADGNRRDWGQLEAEWKLRNEPSVFAGLRYTEFRFARQLDNGYFNPLSFRSPQATLRGIWHPAGNDGPWELQAYAALGEEHAVPDGNKPAYDASLRAAYRFDERTRLEVRAQRFSSRTSASSGFARTIYALHLERNW
ncbi:MULTISPECIES: tetratricopeptide repeat protein [Ramlibacter]|uniref:Tetratricopeptide repeat protein n=1 Tax=Ramlibacter aquaticus TaxID=2780094 RepID=A0ABR9SK01_9BURK|nr:MULTISPECIES: tetratricopeptide repeat protein [Ramlibacter]MBE7942696.1 tetratricopeptide repeat protein [Ramlibacter aquaticus]